MASSLRRASSSKKCWQAHPPRRYAPGRCPAEDKRKHPRTQDHPLANVLTAYQTGDTVKVTFIRTASSSSSMQNSR